jgi:BMFP domain-containing protein YqiC
MKKMNIPTKEEIQKLEDRIKKLEAKKAPVKTVKKPIKNSALRSRGRA